MTNDKTRKNENEAENIEQVLRERDKLDQVIQEKFSRKMAIVFTDVCGYTEYMDKKGDIRGRAWMQKHHDIVSPLITSHGGKILDIMGDGLMCSFENSLSAVESCMAIQKGLEAHNTSTPADDEIHVSIGINVGVILVDKDHIAGDVVNVASRIESKAGKDVILISENVYEEVRGSSDILCRFHDSVSVKGKSKKLNLYRVVWKDEDIGGRVELRVRAEEEAIGDTVSRPVRQLYLEIEKIKDGVKIGSFEQVMGETSTVRQYEEIPAPLDKINARCREIVETLNRVNRQGILSREILVNLKEIGQVFFDDLIPANIKEKVRETKSDHLVVSIDDYMARVPWELLHDGNNFLCQRFSMGRLVRTRQNIIGSSKSRSLGKPLKMLILADPKGDLKEAYNEGLLIRDFFDKAKDVVNATFLSENITPDYVREKFRNFDFVHFAGHADYDEQNQDKSGWKLSNGIFSASDILKMTGTATMPAFIFSNACHTALTDSWNLDENFHGRLFNLANAFILSGVRHYVGTFWEILDEPSQRFAVEFYRNMLSGHCVGEALRLARLAQITEYGEEKITWAGYLLYGDPTFNYMGQVKSYEAVEKATSPEPVSRPLTDIKARAGEDVLDFAGDGEKKQRRKRFRIAAGIASFIIILIGAGVMFLKTDTAKYQEEIKQLYTRAKYDEALDLSRILQGKAPDVRMSYLYEGEILFRKGRLDEAEKKYLQAVEAGKGTPEELSAAYVGLGRLASIRNLQDKAVAYYQLATQADPMNGSGYLAQAMVLDKSGQSGKALDLFQKAGKLVPDDRLVAAMTDETRKKAELATDRKKQEKIDNLVQELTGRMKQPPRATLSDGWTSSPLTVWVMDFAAQGYSLREGEDRLIAAGITDRILQEGRVQVVERALLESMLEEMKLGTTALADRNTALSLGRILAARVMLTGSILYSETETQISMRLIETETGRIAAAVNQTHGNLSSPASIAEKLSHELLDKLKKNYPIRGVITPKGELVELNIGTNVGVVPGQRFKATTADVVVEVVSAQDGASMAKVTQGQTLVEEGQRVEMM